MKVLVTGVNGQLGYEVVELLKKENIECRGVDVGDFDLTDRQAVISYIKEYEPDAVAHCAAFTAVDKAEDEKELCFAINVEGTQSVALACKEIGAKMVYISSDYVFNGQGEQFFETNSVKEPLSVYGQSKSLGEDRITELISKYFIIRTSWVFGANGNNFIKTMLRLSKEKDELSVVNDQVGSPTYAKDLAVIICEMLKSDKYGIYHATNENICSWFDFAKAIIDSSDAKCRLIPVTTEEFGAKAPRPHNSRLSKKSLDEGGFDRLPTWQNALERYLKESI